MTWTKLDDSFYDNPKVVAAGASAVATYVCCLSYCGRHNTDGRVPKIIADRFYGAKAAKRLVEVGLCDFDGDFILSDYLDFNPSKAELEAKREADRLRKRG